MSWARGPICPAHARGGDRHVGFCQRRHQPGAKMRHLVCGPAAAQAFDQTVQRPDIVGMLCAALQIVIQAKIRPVDLLCFLKLALL